MTLALLVLVAGLLAFANGANDNAKGVATLYGSGGLGWRASIGWATVATALGTVVSAILARGLVSRFSGKGLVPDGMVGDPAFLLAVGAGAASTVLLATRLGLPISTTHALTGALAGAGLLASGVDGAVLASKFLLPLLVSPFLALVLAAGTVPLVQRFVGGDVERGEGEAHGQGRTRDEETVCSEGDEPCLCVGDPIEVAAGPVAIAAPRRIVAGTVEVCRASLGDRAMVVTRRGVLRAMHVASAGAVSFARGLNDGPKIAALAIAAGTVGSVHALTGVAVAMALGGVLAARRVGDTMGHRVLDLEERGGLAGNLVTSALVIGASHLAVPVSTTHVSCGALFGVGAVTRTARGRVIAGILLAWVVTLPLAGLVAAVAYAAIARLG